MGVSRLSSLFAGMGYMLCGFFVAHIIHAHIIYILAWLPLIILLLNRGAQKQSLSYFVGAGLLLGATIFPGHPQITFYEFIFLGVYSFYLVLQFRPQKKLVYAYYLLPFFIAGGISMVQILPAFEVTAQSVRSALTLEAASEGSMSPRHFLTFFIPKLFGGIQATGNKELAFWLKDSYHSGYWTFWETSFYTGLPVLVLGLMFLKRKGSKLAYIMTGWGVFSLLIALGTFTPFFGLLFNVVPGFDKFRIASRILFTWNFLLPVFAALFIDATKDHDYFKKQFPYIAGFLGFIFLVCFVTISGLIASIWPDFHESGRLAFAKKQATYAMLIVLMMAGVLAGYYFKKVSFNAYKTSMFTVLLIDLFIFGFGIHMRPFGAPRHYRRNTEAAEYFKAESKKELMRVNMRESGIMVLERNQGMIDKVHFLEGYAQLNLRRKLPPTTHQKMLDLMNVKFAIQVDPGTGMARMALNPSMMPRASMFYKYTVLDNDTAVEKHMRSESFNHRKELVLDKKPALAIPQDTSLTGSVKVVEYKNNRIELEVETPENGLLLLSEIWYPAWKAWIDKKETPVYRADYCFRSIEVPKGKHHVTFKFDSHYFNAGLTITLITFFASIGLLAFPLLSKRVKAANDETKEA